MSTYSIETRGLFSFFNAPMSEAYPIKHMPVCIYFIVLTWHINVENNVCTRVRNCFSAHVRVIFVYLINTKITLEWAQKQFATRVNALFYFLQGIEDLKMTIKSTIFAHRPRVSLGFCSADDVIVDCWWGHITRQLWYNHVKSGNVPFMTPFK